MTIETIDHVQLAMPKGREDEARAFYGAFLGLPEEPKPADMGGRGGCWFHQGAVKVHLGVEEPFNPARKAHVGFQVDDAATLAARAREAGYEVKAGDAYDPFVRVFIYDPFGNRLEFLSPVEER